MMVHYKTNGRRALTETELEMLRKAEKMPIVYDEDCPELTPAMEEAFREARRKNPVRRVPVTLNISQTTLERAKRWDDDYYTDFLARVLDDAMAGYQDTESTKTGGTAMEQSGAAAFSKEQR